MRQEGSKTVLILAEIDEKCNVLDVDISLIEAQLPNLGINTSTKTFLCPHCSHDIATQVEIKLNTDCILDNEPEQKYEFTRAEESPPPPTLTDLGEVFEENEILGMTDQEALPLEIFEPLEYKLIKVAENMEVGNEVYQELFDNVEQVEQPKKDDDNDDFECVECGGLKFRSKYSYRIHKNIHTDKYKCTICGASHSKNERLIAHLKRDHSDEEQLQHAQNVVKLRKEEEDLNFRTVAEQSTAESPKKSFSFDSIEGASRCSACEVDFATIDELFQHFKAEHGEDFFCCGLCKKTLRSKKTFKHHMIRAHTVRTEENAFPCMLCDAKYMLKRDLNLHIAKKHGERRQKQNCAICGELFESTRSLLAHLQLHEEERPHKCDHCSKRFQRLSALKDHILTHTQDKKFICKTCGQRYLRKSYLKIHERIHTGERPFECPREGCETRFYDRGSLRQHKLMHERKEANFQLQEYLDSESEESEVFCEIGVEQ